MAQVSARMAQVSGNSGAGGWGWMVQVRAVSGAGRFWGEGPAPLKRLEGRFLEQVSRVKSDLRHSCY